MKRALAMALGAMMVAGSAATATAASHIDFSGYYKAFQMNDINLGKQDGDRSFSDTYFGHRLRLDMTFTPTDEIAVYYRIEAPNFARWGTGSMYGMNTRHIYGLIKQDWGNVIVGHINDGLDTYGLGSLGYVPSTNWWTTVSPFDTGARLDVVRYFNKWDNGFGIMGQYARVADGAAVNADTQNPGGPTGDWWSDGNADRYQLEGTYEWDGGGAALGFRYDRWANETATRTFDKVNNWYINPAIMHSWGDFSVHAEAMFGWGTVDNFAGHDDDSSGMGFYLDADYNYGPGNVTLAGWWNQGTGFDDNDGKDLVRIDEGNFYPLIVAYNATSSGWGRVGDDSAGNDVANGNAVHDANNAFALFVDKGYAGTGATGFMDISGTVAGVASVNPFTDFANYTDAAGGAVNQWVANVAPTLMGFQNAGMSRERTLDFNGGSANHWGIALTGVHAFTDDISMNYGLGYLALAKPNYRIVDRGTFTATTAGAAGTNAGDGAYNLGYKEQDKSLGFEIDLGFTFKLLDNLEFETQFGYMFNGDAYQRLAGYRADYAVAATNAVTAGATPDSVNMRAVWEDPKDSYVWYNTLTFSF